MQWEVPLEARMGLQVERTNKLLIEMLYLSCAMHETTFSSSLSTEV